MCPLLSYNFNQVWDIYYRHNLYVFNNNKPILKDNYDNIIEALLYILGINTYVVNKETHFKELNDEDYSFMDSLYFEGYSYNLYKESFEIVKQKKEELRKRENRISASLKGLKIGITKATNKEVLERKKEDIISQTSDLSIIQSEIVNCNSILTNTEIIKLGDRKLQKTSNSLCANIMRNCFAHCDRIHITGRDEFGEILITLTDYDNQGEISGIVKTNLTSLIEFLSHDIFMKIINGDIEKENQSKK